MKDPEKKNTLFVDTDGLGRLTIPKAWLDMLEWSGGEAIILVLDTKDNSIRVKKV